MNEDEKITAFRELVKSIKENSKYLSEDFDPDTELEKGKKKNIQKYTKILQIIIIMRSLKMVLLMILLMRFHLIFLIVGVGLD